QDVSRLHCLLADLEEHATAFQLGIKSVRAIFNRAGPRPRRDHTVIVKTFVDRFTKAGRGSVNASDLHSLFCHWHGEMSMRDFGSAIRAFGIRGRKAVLVYYVGRELSDEGKQLAMRYHNRVREFIFG